MHYPAPKSILFDLATTGPSAIRVEALRLLGLPNLPARFPPCERRTRASLLRRLAANKQKAGKARLFAVKELLFSISIEEQQELDQLRKEKQRGRKSTHKNN